MNHTRTLLMKKCGADKEHYGDRVNALVRTRYSLSEELALLRRRDENPEAFAAYTAFCEECKKEAKGEVAE